jgi:hypothetical protein
MVTLSLWDEKHLILLGEGHPHSHKAIDKMGGGATATPPTLVPPKRIFQSFVWAMLFSQSLLQAKGLADRGIFN